MSRVIDVGHRGFSSETAANRFVEFLTEDYGLQSVTLIRDRDSSNQHYVVAWVIESDDTIPKGTWTP